MTTTPPADASSAAAPQLSAQPMLARLLELIRTTTRVEEFTPERLTQAMGVEVRRARDQSQRYGYGEALNAHWNQNFEVDLQRTIGARFNFSFDPAAPDADPPIAELCELDYPAFTARLEAMGFKRTPYHGEHGRFISDGFDRPGMRVAVYPQGDASASGQSTGRRCVKRVQVL
ncbi:MULTISPECIES: hypothetical protein [unclassified Lysobacter]|uniref:hypothetical protein n=1 Tax=unclassified Lysobacter TaxID=2635362 RepID=UPI001BEA9863|nr:MULTISPECIES: hypothetical protein [unclassified Lysobacter]MBT2749151.1 hypothetical protein [Lysobacter sp. ISL-42]MBT2753255.1 hypothetical protein [Lysobacter sp. ISL-50]MBT2776570.1 hypothetical protein [Lysobacter sp. ISL-54]MBT2783287.1 hypothetical protein [Lysobacter sp. ISL-52]